MLVPNAQSVTNHGTSNLGTTATLHTAVLGGPFIGCSLGVGKCRALVIGTNELTEEDLVVGLASKRQENLSSSLSSIVLSQFCVF